MSFWAWGPGWAGPWEVKVQTKFSQEVENVGVVLFRMAGQLAEVDAVRQNGLRR